MAKHILSIDQGTTSSRAILFDNKAQQLGIGQQAFDQIYPQSGWVEHDAEIIWQSVYNSIQDAIADANLALSDVSAIGITNQRETTILWDRATGTPVANAIVWQDRRTAASIDALKAQGHEAEVSKRSGLVLDAYFSASKIGWLLDNIEGLRARAEAGELAFGTVDGWLIYKLTGGALHVTDISNASRTLLCNLERCEWDEWLLELFNVPASLLPTIVDSSGVIGTTSKEVMGAEVPIAGIAGDQQAATFGHLCQEKGSAKNTYGTGCFLVTTSGNEPVASNNKLLSTVAWKRDGQTNYALEGSIFTAGAAINWAASHMGLGGSGKDLSALAAKADNNGGVYFVPALAGLGAPHWNQYAQGTWLGITAATQREHLARAVLEGVAFQVYDMVQAMQKDLSAPLTELMVDGGVCQSDVLMQFQADILGIDIIRPKMVEATALGAAYLAGLAVSVWDDIDALKTLPRDDDRFTPSMDTATRDALLRHWNRAVEAAQIWGQVAA